jgi:hypothetical protein
MLQLQELGLAAIVPNTLDNEGEPQAFAEASKSEAWIVSPIQDHPKPQISTQLAARNEVKIQTRE